MRLEPVMIKSTTVHDRYGNGSKKYNLKMKSFQKRKITLHDKKD